MQKTDDIEIIISDRTRPEFIETTQAVSDYLKQLPLTADQNDMLIMLICNNMIEAERGSFRLGVKLGIAISKKKE